MAKSAIIARVTSNGKDTNCMRRSQVLLTLPAYSKTTRCQIQRAINSVQLLDSNFTLSMTTCNYWTGCDTGLIAVHSPVANSTSYNYNT